MVSERPAAATGSGLPGLPACDTLKGRSRSYHTLSLRGLPV